MERLLSKKWALQDAKAQFSEVVRRANTQGPQVVTYRGIDKAVVISMDEFRQLKPDRPSFVDILLNGPKLDDEIVDAINRRDRSPGRKIKL